MALEASAVDSNAAVLFICTSVDDPVLHCISVQSNRLGADMQDIKRQHAFWPSQLRVVLSKQLLFVELQCLYSTAQLFGVCSGHALV